MKNTRGNVLLLVTVTLLILLIMVPSLVRYVMDESKSTAKISNNTKAFHLAEAALERGYQMILQSTATVAAVSSGTAIAGYNFDTTYADEAGGQYRIRLSSGSGSTIFITAVGRSADGKEVRGVRTQYARQGQLTNAIVAQGAVTNGANSGVHWAPVISRSSINGSKDWPRLYSAGAIVGKDVVNDGNNTDDVQYWAFKPDIPDMPSLDLNFYKNQAIALGAVAAACGDTYYKAGNSTFKKCNGVAGTWYITGTASFQAAAPGNYVTGTMIVLGTFDVQGSAGAHQSLTVPLPPEAWKEYGNSWGTYQPFDTGEPATYNDAVAANYTASCNTTINNILFNGLMYVGGNVSFSGAGNSAVYGAALVMGNVPMNGTFDFYFNPTAAASAATSTRGLQRTSWVDVSCSWTGANTPVCQ